MANPKGVTPPELAPDDQVQFVEFHRPKLPAGDYSFSIQQQIWNDQPGPTKTINIAVLGERFSFKDEDFHTLFPPPGSAGKFHHLLPHVVLNRSTLPWERSPNQGAASLLSPPWLALLLFTDEEAPKPKAIRVADIADRDDHTKKNVASWPQDPPKDFAPVGLWTGLNMESAQHGEDAVTVIGVPWSQLQTQLPSYTELAYTTHVRRIQPAAVNAEPTEPLESEVAVIMGNRLPPVPPPSTDGQPVVQRCVAHLVSLEGRYKISDKSDPDMEPSEPLKSLFEEAVRQIKNNQWVELQQVTTDNQTPTIMAPMEDKKLEEDWSYEKCQIMDLLPKSEQLKLQQLGHYQKSFITPGSTTENSKTVQIDFSYHFVNLKGTTRPQQLPVAHISTETAWDNPPPAPPEIENWLKNIPPALKEKNHSKYTLTLTDKLATSNKVSTSPDIQLVNQGETLNQVLNLLKLDLKDVPKPSTQIQGWINQVYQKGGRSLIVGNDTLPVYWLGNKRFALKNEPFDKDTQTYISPSIKGKVTVTWYKAEIHFDHKNDTEDSLKAPLPVLVKIENMGDGEVRFQLNPEINSIVAVASGDDQFLVNVRISNSRSATFQIVAPYVENATQIQLQPAAYSPPPPDLPQTPTVLYWHKLENVSEALPLPNKAKAFLLPETIFNNRLPDNKLVKYSRQVHISKKWYQVDITVTQEGDTKESDTKENNTKKTAVFRLHPSQKLVFDCQGAEDDTPIQLVSLKSWAFNCQPDSQDFVGLFNDLNKKRDAAGKITRHENSNITFARPTSNGVNEHAGNYLKAGYVPLPHHWRQGDRNVSWYRSPFLPHPPAEKEYQFFNLPVRTADELLIFNKSIGMFDASYAAAWELGRLLALHDKAFALKLHHWKRARAQDVVYLRQQIDHDYLPLVKHVPSDVDLPAELADWLARLTRLENVPFNYLIPDEGLLPPESLRVFAVDPLWLECLRDGAFSIGRVSHPDYHNDVAHWDGLKSPPTISGFLLRSAIVATWPKMTVTGYATRFEDEHKHWERDSHLGSAPAYHQLSILRLENLAPDLMLGLYYDPKNTGRTLDFLEFHLPPEILHFGLEEDADKGDFIKMLRHPKSGGNWILKLADEKPDNLPVSLIEITLPKLETGVLRLGAEANYQTDLKKGVLSPDFRQEFEDHKIALSEKVGITEMVAGSRWRIEDKDQSRTYIAMSEQNKDNEKVINVYEEFSSAARTYFRSKMSFKVAVKWLEADIRSNLEGHDAVTEPVIKLLAQAITELAESETEKANNKTTQSAKEAYLKTASAYLEDGIIFLTADGADTVVDTQLKNASDQLDSLQDIRKYSKDELLTAVNNNELALTALINQAFGDDVTTQSKPKDDGGTPTKHPALAQSYTIIQLSIAKAKEDLKTAQGKVKALLMYEFDSGALDDHTMSLQKRYDQANLAWLKNTLKNKLDISEQAKSLIEEQAIKELVKRKADETTTINVYVEKNKFATLSALVVEAISKQLEAARTVLEKVQTLTTVEDSELSETVNNDSLALTALNKYIIAKYTLTDQGHEKKTYAITQIMVDKAIADLKTAQNNIQQLKTDQSKEALKLTDFDSVWENVATKYARETVSLTDDPDMWRENSGKMQVLDMAHLFHVIADRLQAKVKNRPITAGDFGLQMLDSPPMIRFKINWSKQ